MMKDNICFFGGDFPGRFLHITPEGGGCILEREVYTCEEGELFRRKFGKEKNTLSLTAFEEKTYERIDLREFLVGEDLIWEVPEGEWRVEHYFCEKGDGVDLLDPEATFIYVEKLVSEAEREGKLIGTRGILFGPVGFCGEGRRDWSPLLNHYFAEQIGVDPFPFYPALYSDIGKKTEQVRSLFFSVRAKMLSESVGSALTGVCGKRGIAFSLYPEDAKLTSPGWLYGDNYLLNQKTDFPFLRVRGETSYSINAAFSIIGSAAVSGREAAALFGEGDPCPKKDLIRDAVNLLAKGFSSLCCVQKDDDISSLLSRACGRIGKGRPICDVCVVYPGSALNGRIRFSDSLRGKGDLPDAPDFADYPNIMNALWHICGISALLVREEDIASASVCGSELRLATPRGELTFQVLLLPGRDIISLSCLKKALDFFHAGGKVFATGELPFRSTGLSSEENEQVGSLIRELFGVGENVGVRFDPFFENKSPSGGKAVYIPPSEPMADGSPMPSPLLLRELLLSSGFISDVEIVGMPRVFHRGILNLPYRVFRNLKKTTERSVSGFFGFFHRKGENGSVWIFSNTAFRGFEGEVFLKGRFEKLLCFNPATGEETTVFPKNEDGRSRVALSIPSGACRILSEPVK